MSKELLDTPLVVHNFSVSTDSAIKENFEAVIDLWKKNRSTLGLFPRGAFEEHARKNLILYLIEGGDVKGYLLYRIARQRVAISHLCVSDEIRGKGGARILFEALRQHVDDGYCKGIEVRCRSDYDISRMWPSLGFEHAGHMQGKAKGGSEITIWYFKFDIPDFFYEMMPRHDDDSLTWAVIDANIVFKMSDPEKAENEEALALISDAMTPYVRYFVTPEIFVETERKKRQEEKKISNYQAKKFEKIEVKRSAFESYREALSPLWGRKLNDRDRSDLHHIAYSTAAGFQYFITLDTGILDKADDIYEMCNISVLRPVEFITQLDQIENLEKYTPRSISRTRYHVHCPLSEEISSIAEHFCIPSHEEKRKVLEAKIRTAIANPKQYTVLLISNNDKQKVAFLCFKKIDGELSIDIMRHSGDVTSRTIAQNFAWAEIFSHAGGDVSLIKYTDKFSSFQNDDLFQANGFIKADAGWVRISANVICDLAAARDKISDFSYDLRGIDESVRNSLSSFLEAGDNATLYEEAFWPLKVTGCDIPTYLIPIRPVWALHLFDVALAEKELWGADPTKHFNIENVYYRSSKRFNMLSGARILWYVSSHGANKVSEIRACSRLISSETDTAKRLFKKYKRLGIYEWSNLMEITKCDPDGEVMAMRFYQTEYFKKPIELKDFQNYGIKGQPFGPKNITNEQFINIYTDGMN